MKKSFSFLLLLLAAFTSSSQVDASMQNKKRHMLRINMLSPIKNTFSGEYEYMLKNNLGLCADFGAIGINESESPFLQPYGWTSGIAIKLYNQEYILPERSKDYQKASALGVFFTSRIGYESFSAWTENPNFVETMLISSTNPYYVKFDRQFATLLLGGGLQARIANFINIESGYAIGYTAFNKSTLGEISEISRQNLMFHQGNLYDRNSGLSGRFWISVGVQI